MSDDYMVRITIDIRKNGDGSIVLDQTKAGRAPTEDDLEALDDDENEEPRPPRKMSPEEYAHEMGEHRLRPVFGCQLCVDKAASLD